MTSSPPPTPAALPRKAPLPYLMWGWIGSGVLHVLAVLLLIYFMGSFGQPGGMVQESLEYHSVGLYDKSSRTPSEHQQPNDASASVDDDGPWREMQRPAQQAATPLVTPDAEETIPLADPHPSPSTADSLRANAANMIGAGEQAVAQTEAIPQATAGGSVGQMAAPPPAGTVSFFNISDTGKSFVFVVDMSQSMLEEQAFDAARDQILAGLRNLKIEQKFQVIFYNRDLHEFYLPGRRPELLSASPVHITLARNFIESQIPSGGTLHQPALLAAIGYRPEVIFFLTDALEPKLNAAELERLRLFNRGCKIHTVEFGSGPDLDRALNFLERLASQNHGTHRYVDVKSLQVGEN